LRAGRPGAADAPGLLAIERTASSVTVTRGRLNMEKPGGGEKPGITKNRKVEGAMGGGETALPRRPP
jgi:hypothetical protein